MKTTLVIEDDNDIRESISNTLKLSGYNVLEASKGSEGVNLAIKHKPDIILCANNLLEIEGYHVLQIFNRNPITSQIPVICLTSKNERVDMKKAVGFGVDDCLIKPFNDLELLKIVETGLIKKFQHQDYYDRSLHNLEKLVTHNSDNLSELNDITAGRKIREIKKKQVLYYEGDQAQFLYLLLEGTIKTIKLAEDGRELMTGLYKADDYIGVCALLMDEPFSDTAEALEDATVCLLSRQMVLDLIKKYPDVSQQFIKSLAITIRQKEEQLLEMAYLSVRKRLAQVIVRLSRQLRNSSLFKISRDELASMAGMATETVSRTLSDFKEEKLIEKKGSQIHILDINRLIKLKN